jgi:hypothetical protein
VRLVGAKSEHRQSPDLIPEFEQLYRDAAPQLWRAIYGFVGGRRQVAEDAVAEAFARAIEHADEIRSPSPGSIERPSASRFESSSARGVDHLNFRNRPRGSTPGRCRTS